MRVIIIVSCLSILFNTLRKDLAAHRKTGLIITITSLAIPIFLLTLFDLPFVVPSIIGYMVSLELLIAILCITIIKIREAIVARQKGLLLLTLCISLLMPLSNFLFLTYILGWPLTLATFAYPEMLGYLIPFASLGTLLLTIANGEMSKKTFSRALVPATILTLIMAMNLVASIVWDLAHGILENLWAFDPTPIIPFGVHWKYNAPLVVNAIVMAVAVGIALFALLRGFGMLATLRERPKEAHQAQTQQQM